MKHIEELEFMKLAKVFALHEFWTHDAAKKQIFIVHNQREAEAVKGQDNSEVIILTQASDLPMMGAGIEIYLSRTVVAILLYQGKSAIEYLLKNNQDLSTSMGVFKQELLAQIKHEKDAHTNTETNFRDALHISQNQVKELQATCTEQHRELKKYEMLNQTEKGKKKKELIDKLCQENEELKRINDGLENRLSAFKLLEDHT